ncbi:hypothetical protein ACQ5SP_01680 [Rhodovulum sp. YNF3179]|uniref:hypothetical protein n=1 Tax=Rhodovulum sp. YNF3179 TaxID=3425127 RepID=UPI003D32C0D9
MDSQKQQRPRQTVSPAPSSGPAGDPWRDIVAELFQAPPASAAMVEDLLDRIEREAGRGAGL